MIKSLLQMLQLQMQIKWRSRAIWSNLVQNPAVKRSKSKHKIGIARIVPLSTFKLLHRQKIRNEQSNRLVKYTLQRRKVIIRRDNCSRRLFSKDLRRHQSRAIWIGNSQKNLVLQLDLPRSLQWARGRIYGNRALWWRARRSKLQISVSRAHSSI